VDGGVIIKGLSCYGSWWIREWESDFGVMAEYFNVKINGYVPPK